MEKYLSVFTFSPLLLAAFGWLSICEIPFTDGATRLAGEIGNSVARLHQSSAPSLEMKHRPKPIPYGVKGRYEIVMQSSLGSPGTCGSLLVGDLDSHNYQNWGYNWATTSHLNYVRVPRELRIRKNAGEVTVVVLERRVDGSVEVTDLR